MCVRLGRPESWDEFDPDDYPLAGTDGNCEEFYCAPNFGCVGHETLC